MPFEITITRDFSASHQLRLYDGALEPLHGHNWHVRVPIAAKALDDIGVVMDFHELQRLLGVIIKPMHNGHLNDLAAFKSANPSAENVAFHIAKALPLPVGVKLRHVKCGKRRIAGQDILLRQPPIGELQCGNDRLTQGSALNTIAGVK